MESGNTLSTSRRYGRLHGTAFFYDRTFNDAVPFLMFMREKVGEERWKDFCRGFAESKDGRHKRAHRALKSLQKAQYGCRCEEFEERAAICEDDEKARELLCLKCKKAVPLCVKE